MSDFVIRKDKVEQGDTVVSVFTFKGRHDFENEDGYPMLIVEENEENKLFEIPDAYAILMTRGNKVNYYVKRGKYGRLFNPIGLYSEGTAGKQMRHAGRPEWRLETTNKKVFDNYINFLKTKNVAWLNNAEREV